MNASTILIITGIILLFIPLPPFATIAGCLCIGAGVLMKFT